MKTTKLLKKIQPKWQECVIDLMQEGSETSEDFRQQLSDFFMLLTKAVETGDPTYLDVILVKWINSLTQTDLSLGIISTSSILDHMLLSTYEASCSLPSSKDALALVGAVLPIYIYTMDKAARLEMEAHILFASKEQKEVQGKLERLDQSKSNFIAVAAHELKTPLTLIDGYTAMLKDTLRTSNTHSQIDMFLNGIINGTSRLRTIVDDMIDVSRIDNNLLSLTFQPVWLNQLFLLLKSELLPTLALRKQHLEIEEFQGDSQMFFADPERLYQSFRNILINAIKYTPDSGMISIDGRQLPGFIEVIINDTGIGISEVDKISIFGKFGQLGVSDLHSSGKTKFKGGGPGLGLPIARGIIEAHGGAIWVESKGFDEIKCPGSTFHIMLPVRSEPSDPNLAELLGFTQKDLHFASKEQN
jgi:signal transduction histidine kinase